MDDHPKQYDLEERTYRFAQRVRDFVKVLAKTLGNLEDSKQVLRASGSVGPNYIKANEALSKKDFIMRIKICRKESKEVVIGSDWLIAGDDGALETERAALKQESTELMKIFGAILRKSE